MFLLVADIALKKAVLATFVCVEGDLVEYLIASLHSYKILAKKFYPRCLQKTLSTYCEWLNEEKDRKSQPKMFLQKLLPFWAPFSIYIDNWWVWY